MWDLPLGAFQVQCVEERVEKGESVGVKNCVILDHNLLA